MKPGSKTLSLVLSPFMLAILPAFMFFLILPPVASENRLSVEAGGSASYEFCYADLDSDNVSELISIGRITPYWHVLVRTSDRRVHDQWNLRDSLDINLYGLFFGNYDHDRFSEIYIFTHSGDSLFLNVNEFFEKSGIHEDRIFITKIGLLHGGVTTMVHPVGFFDEDGDRSDELYFGLGTGFSLEPRRQCCFNLVTKKLITSSFTGIIPISAKMADVDGDSKPEIFGHIAASGNYRTKAPYSDSSAWLMVFNEKLEFEFEPVEFRGFSNYIWVNAYKTDSGSYYLVNKIKGGADTSVTESRIMLFSPGGRLLKYRRNSDFDNSPDLKLFVIKHKLQDRIYLFNQRFIELNSDLREMRTVGLQYSSGTYPYVVDINNDGEDEFLLYYKDEGRLAVYSGGLEKYCEADFDAESPDIAFSHFYAGRNTHKLFATSAGKGYFLELIKNKYYFLGYLVYPGIYALFFFFILLIRKINTAQVEQREAVKRRLLTLQLQGIKSQLDPHFTFNALNSVASLVYMDDRQKAYDYLNKFTRLIRCLLTDSEKIYRTLDEEIDFVTTYLELEKLRFGSRLDYEIFVGEGITRLEQVPKLVLHTFAENAVKHGIANSTRDGMLKIRITRRNENMYIEITDNGIGRMKAAGLSTSTGKGLSMTNEFFDLLNKIYDDSVKLTVTDLENENGTASGTKIEVVIPVHF